MSSKSKKEKTVAVQDNDGGITGYIYRFIKKVLTNLTFFQSHFFMFALFVLFFSFIFF